MSFMCQKDSYLKEFETKVKRCTPAKKKNVEGYNVILEDTILFPEGGGQPTDFGKINSIDCQDVKRDGAEAVHFISEEISEGSLVKLQVDWDRRFDHMQQHTAQHLVTAVADRLFGYQTTSWNIGSWPSVVTIELSTGSVTQTELQDIELNVNQYLQSNLSVTPSFYENKDDPELLQFRGLGLPDDHVGVVRVLSIDGIDHALCCGTHVSNLAHIQAVKILAVEKGKKGKTNLMFLAGNRLLQNAQTSYEREKKLTGILKGPGDKHCELAEKAVKHFKAQQKACVALARELATLEAKIFNNSELKDSVFVKHRKEGDQDYISVLLAELGDENLPKLISTGDDKDGGMFVLAGPSQLLQDLGPKVCEMFEGKGALSKGAYRGKAGKPEKGRVKAEAELRAYLTVKDKTGHAELSDPDCSDSEIEEKDDSINTSQDSASSPNKTVSLIENRKLKLKNSKRVVVSNIPYSLKSQEIKDKFKKEIGEVVRVDLLEGLNGKSLGTATIEFTCTEHAMQAIELFHNRKINDRSLKVRAEKEKDKKALKQNQKMKASKAEGVLGAAPVQDGRGTLPSTSLNHLSGINPVIYQMDTEVMSSVLVTNIAPRVTESKLRDVFQLAGNVLLVKITKLDGCRLATITFAHPLEAMESVSLFDNQVLFDKKLSVKLSRPKDMMQKLPAGLQSIGPGLGLGNPAYAQRSLSLADQILQQELVLKEKLATHSMNGSGMDPLNFGCLPQGDARGNYCVSVKNLDYSTDWRRLKDHFSDMGHVKYVEIFKDASGKSTGVGLVRFSTFEEVQRAVMIKNRSRLDRRTLDVRPRS